jgi:SAM-dependent methyltransferase
MRAAQAGRYHTRRLKFRTGLSLPRTDLKIHSHGFCNVCGQNAEFYATHSTNYRESLYCSYCRSTARSRMLASGILQVVEAPSSRCIAELAKVKVGPQILDTDCYSPIFQYLRNAKFYSSSVYLPELDFGAEVYSKVTNVNLEEMPFQDESFDIIVTSDVMEHVRRDHLAHAEIRRCLKPSGYYIFTVPFVPQWEKNQIRVDSTGSEDVALMDNEYHGDPVSGKGILVYRIYGNELIEHMKELGFEVEFDSQPDDHGGMPTKDVFICRKRS